MSIEVVSVDISKGCNSRCTFCDLWNSPQRATKYASYIVNHTKPWTLILNEIAAILPRPLVRVSCSGEPLLHIDHFKSFVEAATKRNLKVEITTNAHLLSLSTAEFLKEHDVDVIVSLEGIEDCYETHRGKPWNLFACGVANAKAAGLKLKANVTVTKLGLTTLKATVAWMKSTGIVSATFEPLRREFSQGRHQANDLCLDASCINAIKQSNLSIETQQYLTDFIFREPLNCNMPEHAFLAADGLWYPCYSTFPDGSANHAWDSTHSTINEIAKTPEFKAAMAAKSACQRFDCSYGSCQQGKAHNASYSPNSD